MSPDDYFKAIKGDITALHTDAIVNAANNALLGGGGVDGAIHRAAGPQLLEACKTLGGCATGETKATRGYRLPARYVFHTVGPVWRGGNQGEPELLANCYRSCLALALEYEIDSIAFPAISCGVYGYPLEQACDIAVSECYCFVKQNPNSLTEIVFACFDTATQRAYTESLNVIDAS